MSTRSFIARKTDVGYQGVYCHWDGYPEHNGVILQTFYSESGKLAYLLSFGDISSLGPEVGDDHAFDDRPVGVTTFYGRDRGETGKHTRPTVFASKCDVLESAAAIGCEFVYIFDKNCWSYCERGPQYFGEDDGTEFSDLRPLEPLISQMF